MITHILVIRTTCSLTNHRIFNSYVSYIEHSIKRIKIKIKA